MRIDVRWAGGEADRIQRLAKELVDLQPEVVLAMTTPSVKAVLRETHTIPVVFTATVVTKRTQRLHGVWD